jgi:hypothetical protein
MMDDTDDIPVPVADDAPTPDQFDLPSEAPDLFAGDLAAVTHDGEVFCLECANPEYVDLCNEDPRQIPYGGPVLRSGEWDCPGPSCGHCFRRIAHLTVLHYDGVCKPATCPFSTECSTCGTYLYPDDSAVETISGREDKDTTIVCTDCARRAGVDTGAFGRTTRQLLDS